MLVFVLGGSLILTFLVATGLGDAQEQDFEARVKAIAEMLPEQATGLGRPANDRAAWEKLRQQEWAEGLLRRAEALLTEPLPEQPDDLYLDFSRTGNRSRWQRVSGQRRGRIAPLVLAECLENKGRFLPAFEELVRALCAERTWVMPAHDEKLTNFEGTSIDIDLASSALAWQLATAAYVLGDKLSSEVRQLIRDSVRRFVLDPYMDMVVGKRPRNWWMNTTNNWNAVCLAGVTGAGLAQVERREDRARFVAAAELYSRNFLAGFTPDGYCSEGLGYWNYGFGHYVLLAETVAQATGGQVDLLARPEARQPALFGLRIQIINGVSPAFADCSIDARPAAPTMYYLNRRFNLGLQEYDELSPESVINTLTEALIFLFPNTLSTLEPASEGAAPELELRTYFEHAGILLGRPKKGSPCRLGVALKGGHNNEHHNHNDVGTYVVVLGERALLLDPGSEVYTARTFSSRRYESNLLNSYGHPVPVVAGKLQQTGSEARAEVLRTEFSEAQDLFALDLKAAYDVPELTKLERTFVYSREGQGSLTVTDRVEYSQPQTFETALLTLGQWELLEATSLLVYDAQEAVRVDVESPDCGFKVKAEEIIEEGAHPTRLGIVLDRPVQAATVTMRITPYTDQMDGGVSGLLRNGGFERGVWGWELPAGCLGSISEERAAGGSRSLKIVDQSKTAGSNISSVPIPAPGGGPFEIRGKVLHVSGTGIGMYVRYLDARRRLLNEIDAKGNMAPVGSLTGALGEWVPFAFRFEAPKETAFLQVWIHSYNAAEVEAYLDDLELVAVEQ